MIINTDYHDIILLRRIIMQSIPNYCFDDITIISNNSLLDNDHIKKRISNIPVRGIYFKDHKDKILIEFIKSNLELIVNHNFNSINKNNLPVLTMKCYKQYDNSKTDMIQSVTTEDCLFFLGDKEIKNPYKKNMSFKIVDLKYNNSEQEYIEFLAVSNINIPYFSSLYCLTETPIVKLDYTEEKKQDLTVVSRDSGITEKQILGISVLIFKTKMEYLLNKISATEGKKGRIVVNNDLYTLPNYLAYHLNKSKDINIATSHHDNLLDKNGFVTFVINEKSKRKIGEIIKEFYLKTLKSFNKIV